MIIARLMGGLGNQMFQYAAGKRLAMARGVELKLDTGFYGRFDSRSYALDAFAISEEIAIRSEIRHLRYGGKPWWRLQTNKGRRAAKEHSPSHIKEKHFHFDESILNLGEEAYLDGYWQSERYFADVSGEIRNLFTPVSVCERARGMADRINSSQSVSLHVRRGDYVEDDKASKVFHSLPIDYFMRAVDQLEKSVETFKIYLFSDDLPWAQENIARDFDTIPVNIGRELSPAEDMWLMSQCDHNIITNSSFSWWGGWLNSNVGKTVIAPLNWFRSEKYDTVDLIPPAWLRL